jgi:hypothetical protein
MRLRRVLISSIYMRACSQQRVDDLRQLLEMREAGRNELLDTSLCPRAAPLSVSFPEGAATGRSLLGIKTSAAACSGVSKWLISVPWPKFFEFTSAPAAMSRRAVTAAAEAADRQARNNGVLVLRYE